MIVLALVAVIWMSVSPVDAHDSFRAFGTPTPMATRMPVKQFPAPRVSQSSEPYRSTIFIRDDGASSPVATIFSNEPQTTPFTVTLKVTQWTGAPLPKEQTYALSSAMQTPQGGELVDNWQKIFTDTFESTFPTNPPCTLQDLSNDGFDRKWGKDSLHVFEGSWAIWPARGGADGVNPANNVYPPNMESRLVCGPFDFANAQTLMTRFMRWMDIDDPNDKFWWGWSTDGTWFTWFGQA
jgi:hypothetical protein